MQTSDSYVIVRLCLTTAWRGVCQFQWADHMLVRPKRADTVWNVSCCWEVIWAKDIPVRRGDTLPLYHCWCMGSLMSLTVGRMNCCLTLAVWFSYWWTPPVAKPGARCVERLTHAPVNRWSVSSWFCAHLLVSDFPNRLAQTILSHKHAQGTSSLFI